MNWKHEKARELIKRNGRTTQWLADHCGIEVGSMRNILRGDKPSLPVVKLMALALGCDESDSMSAPTPARKAQG